MADFQKLAAEVLQAVEGYVARGVAAVSTRVDSLCGDIATLAAARPVPGPAGLTGKDGATGVPGPAGATGDVGQKGPAGEPGAPGEGGASGEPGPVGPAGAMGAPGADGLVGPEGPRGQAGADGVAGATGAKGEPGPAGEKGVDGAGRDGRDGLAGAKGDRGDSGRDASDIEPIPAIDEAKGYPRGTWAKHAGGLWLARSATDGMTGWDCVVEGVESIGAIEAGDVRRFTLRVATSSGKALALPFTVPSMIYRGVWTDGEFELGDCVTWDGSLWHCEVAATKAKPGTNADFKLVAKRGRDGRDGKNGDRGAQGVPGKPGKDAF